MKGRLETPLDFKYILFFLENFNILTHLSLSIDLLYGHGFPSIATWKILIPLLKHIISNI